MSDTMTAATARMFREGYNAYVRRLNRMTTTQLRTLERDELSAQDIVCVYGGPASKDELIRALCAMRYPLARLNETTHVLYHQPGENWSACEWCVTP